MPTHTSQSLSFTHADTHASDSTDSESSAYSAYSANGENVKPAECSAPDALPEQPALPELLAPAGGPAALHAAITAGADAVYLGLEDFNARRGAENFTLSTLREACDYAHARGRKIYITLNTMILPREAGAAMELARQAWRKGADAFIVQDIGIATEISRTLPQARLHISTQMNIHDEAGIRAAAALGAARVTMARELSLPEIAHLAKYAREFDLELECFAHGALCVCYSGQCLMSSLIGGRSANRGLCAQACRLPYELRNRALRKSLPAPGEHLLSPMDLCTIDLLPELAATGVASLKIEGRLKSPEYVFAATSAYRAALDELAANEGTTEAANASGAYVTSTQPSRKDALEDVFSRGFTTAYLEGKRGNDIMSYQRPNNRGAYLGRITDVIDDAACFTPSRPLEPGDILEIWTGKGRSAHTVTESCLRARGEVQLKLDRANRDDRAVRSGDRIFRVRSAAAAFNDDAREPRIPVHATVVLKRDTPAYVSFSTERAGEHIVGEALGAPVETARTKALTASDVRAHIDRLGQTPFIIESFDLDLDDNVGMGFSQLHHLRTDALDAVWEQLLAPFANRKLERTERLDPLPPVHTGGCHVYAWATNPACARAAKKAGAEAIYVPALNYKRGEACIAGQLSETAEQAGYPKGCVIALPTVHHDSLSFDGDIYPNRESARELDISEYVKEGKPVFADSLSAAFRALEEGADVEFGPHIPLANKLARDTAARMGATRIWLSPELTCKQIAALADDTPVPLGLTVIGTQELMVTEHCALMSQGPCNEECASCPRRKSPHYLVDRKGFEFPVITDAFGRSHIYNSVQLDVAHALPELITAGISAIMVDTTLMNTEETSAAVARAVRARNIALRDGNTVARKQDTTTGHLFRGVQ